MPLFGKTAPEEMILEIVLLIVIAFMPSIIYMIALRYIEKYDREPWGSIGTVFLWGATMGVVAVIIVRGIFRVHFQDYDPDLATDRKYVELVLAVLITPVIAEIIKPIGLLFVRHDIEESEDGLIYGAVAGLGYAATENLLYGIFLVSIYGMEFFIYVIIVRSISVVLLNASASAITGYGVSRATAVKHKVGSIYAFPLFLFAAIGMHSMFNYLMVSGVGITDLVSVGSSFSFAIIISIGMMTWIYFKIYRLDRMDEKNMSEDEYDDDDEEFWPEGERGRRAQPAPRRDDYYGRPPGHGPPGGGPPRDDYYAHQPQRRPHDDYYDRGRHPPPQGHPGRARGPQYDDSHGRRPPAAAPHPSAVRSQEPPARRPAPPPEVYSEQPRRDVPRKAKVFEAEWSAPKQPKAAPRPKRPVEPVVAEPEAVDWEEVVEDTPAEPPKKSRGKSSKKPGKVDWSDDDISVDDSESEDMGWFEDD